METEILKRRLWGHTWLLYSKSRLFRYKIKNYAEQMHRQIIALGKGQCPYCGMVL
jgi:hypothetical protein